MAETPDNPAPPPEAAEAPPAAQTQLDQGAYEVIRNRLRRHGGELRQRIDRLNERRREVFGSIETRLVGTDRITTAHNCVPRDLVDLGHRFIFGYNVRFGLKAEINLEDVFAVYRFEGGRFHPEPLELIADPRFEKDFKDLYRYYKNTRFAKFFCRGPYVYMKFRVGNSPDDFKAFKWSIEGEKLVYVDNRSDHEVVYPRQHEFEWRRAGRDHQVQGAHPHVSIEDKVFVDTLEGTLTIKVENNTAIGAGVFEEPVDNPDQTLDDTEFFYAVLGHIVVLKIRPYQEQAFRYYIYNAKLQQAVRMDGLADAAVLLPDDQGLIFPGGYYLASGRRQLFPIEVRGLVFEQRIASPNGEDYLYVFYQREQGVYILLSYNVIEQAIETPVVCHGFTIFDDGQMVYFKTQEEPARHHTIQIWQTPYVGADQAPPGQSDSMLYKIGNADIVRAMAECHEALALIERDEPYADLYVDIVRKTADVLDTYFWLDEAEAAAPGEPLREIRSAAEAAIGEFEKVTRVRRATETQVSQVDAEAQELFRANATKIYETINHYVAALAGLRAILGRIIALRELRYVDLDKVAALEAEAEAQSDQISRRTVAFLLKPDALRPYSASAAEQAGRIGDLQTVAQGRELEQQIAESTRQLELLIEIVSNLEIDDATKRTQIIDDISAIFSRFNTARSELRNRIGELGRREGIAEFNSQLKLLNQSVATYLDVCDTPEKTDEYLTRVMVQIEELEGRFAEFDEFVVQLSEKREEVYNAFENRRLSLVERRNKRANALAQAADRILNAIAARVANFTEIEQINGYFASDLMIQKVREVVGELSDLDESVKVDDIQSRLKSIREDAARQLKDRQDLFVEGENVIRFGRHLFNVNTQEFELATVLRDDAMQLHLAGTRFFQPIDDEAFNATRDVWDRQVVSESPEVYRGEYLAYRMLLAAGRDDQPDAAAMAQLNDAGRLELVQRFMGPRYREGYTKGVHDLDAAKILGALVELSASIDLLRYRSRCRAVAQLFWRTYDDEPRKRLIATRLGGFAEITRAFPRATRQDQYIDELKFLIGQFTQTTPLFGEDVVDEAAEYLFHELAGERKSFVVSPEAAALHEAFESHLKQTRAARRFAASLENVKDHPPSVFLMARDWVAAFVASDASADFAAESHGEYVDEVATLLFEGKCDPTRIVRSSVRRELTGLVGSHPRIREGRLALHYNHFMARLARFQEVDVPRFERFTEMKRQILERHREAMRLDEFKPRVLTSFVRNRLIDEVYLPLIGDNLAKQLGAAGDDKRTDRQGLLLVISPPGYGKTTLMEYIANRLGLVFMKINGPAIGHGVTSLDPAEARNASAREELEKLNLAFEMGDNVMIYVDDIQHTHPEFLQKFISLCDAQRKIEGVYEGRPRTYDLRGRKVAVVMAGNPYTEQGGRFQIPDMLANRADTYNLGDIIGEHGEAFRLSYLENAVTSNPTLNRLASRDRADVHAVVRMAETGRREGVELKGNFALDELNEMVDVMAKLLKVRDVILRVNQQYIASAGQEDQYRTEPPFGLQGSYRNMNRIAERISPVMNDEELEALIRSAYERDAQTLTRGAEANLLKFREITGTLDGPDAERWAQIKRTFQRNNAVKAMGGDDRTAQVLTQMAGLNQQLGDIRDAIRRAAETADGDGRDRPAGPQALQATFDGPTLELTRSLIEKLSGTIERLAAPPPPPAATAIEAKFDIATLEALTEIADRVGEAVARLGGAAAPAGPVAPPPVTLPEPSDDAPPRPDDRVHAAPPHRQEITVINKVPATFLYILKEQFGLMQRWLEPITRLAAGQEAKLEQVAAAIADLTAQYERTIERLENSRDQSLEE